MPIIDRVTGLLRRRQRARRFRVPYSRDRSWRTPQEIEIRGIRLPLHLPRDQGTRIAFKDIFLEDVYGLLSLKETPERILDIGAHAGLFSLYARALFPQAIIHAYEPNPAVEQHLHHQSEIGGFTVFNQAVAGAPGFARLVMGADSVFTRTISEAGGEIPIIGIYEAIRRLGGKADVLKLDCEGCEWTILQRKETLGPTRFLTLEYHLSDGQTLAEISRLVAQAGFQIGFLREDGDRNGRIWGVKVAGVAPPP